MSKNIKLNNGEEIPSIGYGTNKDDLNNLEEENVPIEDTWRAMEELVKLGLTKNIGLSNFNSIQIDRILKIATIKPVVNQKKLIEFCIQREIVIMAYFPFLGTPIPGMPKSVANLFEEPVIKELGTKYEKSAAQIVLKYLSQIGTIPIPKSDNFERISENIDIFDFSLTSEEMGRMDSLNKNIRSAKLLMFKHFKEYPYNIEY